MAGRSALRQALQDVAAVAFDGYGTLFDFTEPDFVATMAEICGQQGLDADASDLWRRFLKASYLMRSEHHEDPVYKRYDQAWADQFEHVFKRLRLEGDAWAASMHLKRRLASAPVFEDVGDVVDALRPHYKLALLSNADDDFLSECMTRNGLEFETVVSSEQAGAIKPNPAIFQHLGRRLGLPVNRILYVGDNPIPDVLGPKRAGMPAAWINRNGFRKPRKVPPPDIRIRSLTEMVPLLVPRDGNGNG
jgi:2-haloalkanoic acid dehalogenase type II